MLQCFMIADGFSFLAPTLLFRPADSPLPVPDLRPNLTLSSLFLALSREGFALVHSLHSKSKRIPFFFNPLRALLRKHRGCHYKRFAQTFNKHSGLRPNSSFNPPAPPASLLGSFR